MTILIQHYQQFSKENLESNFSLMFTGVIMPHKTQKPMFSRTSQKHKSHYFSFLNLCLM